VGRERWEEVITTSLETLVAILYSIGGWYYIVELSVIELLAKPRSAILPRIVFAILGRY
jgi:hypothetical protein